jgi:hypothetical protein
MAPHGPELIAICDEFPQAISASSVSSCENLPGLHCLAGSARGFAQRLFAG